MIFAQSKGLQPGAKATFFLSFFGGAPGGPKPEVEVEVEVVLVVGILRFAPEAPPTPAGAVKAVVLGGTRRLDEVEGTPRSDFKEDGFEDVLVVDVELEPELEWLLLLIGNLEAEDR